MSIYICIKHLSRNSILYLIKRSKLRENISSHFFLLFKSFNVLRIDLFMNIWCMYSKLDVFSNALMKEKNIELK